MKLKKFLKSCNNRNITIMGYCENKEYDFLYKPSKEEMDSWPKHIHLRCICNEEWWKEVKERKIRNWFVVEGSVPTEICIDLEDIN